MSVLFAAIGEIREGIAPWESELRARIVAEARSWIRTPYAMGQMQKGMGCDCGTLIIAVLNACGISCDERIEPLGADWFHHRKDEMYQRKAFKYARKTTEAIAYPTLAILPGNIVLTRCGESRIYNHGGIVTVWPKLVHCARYGVQEDDATQHDFWSFKKIAVFDPIAPLKEKVARG